MGAVKNPLSGRIFPVSCLYVFICVYVPDSANINKRQVCDLEGVGRGGGDGNGEFLES